ncbi:Superoxide dismutase [Mn]-like protein [Hapsidospora chrysogenum ATCC 11550]|uniref:Superoxide dismutase n=1 Tax=Hapsidospora chrysogenum (strain ATCC 11550 / CBS 779.69 / DSM 880 / IAM 14645 / JCM 23072 / IMI 49137) TaxID=857340 RepID=A0A086SZX0_HAPC1|nr:Superoxide dismutase [Mn]-like protein [Hapsidospora chrysogenum ATCC 11550]
MSVGTYSLPALPYAYNVCPAFPALQGLVNPEPVAPWILPDLPYSYDALEPSISAQIMELHHSKHHQTYVNNLNNALKSYSTATSSNDIAQQISLQAAIRFNGGGHINHSLFWQNLAPATSPDANPDSAPGLVEAINKTWGSVDGFQGTFNKALLGIQGSGWGWLVKDAHGLRIITTKDQDPVVGGEVPIIGIDMWEHAYYLQYLNGKAAYVENIWKVINWKTAEARFHGGAADAFKVLKASI